MIAAIVVEQILLAKLKRNAAFCASRLSFTQTRLASSGYLQFSEIELPGLLLDGNHAPPPPTPPTPSPTVSTGNPTEMPSLGLETLSPTSGSPTLIQTGAPITSSGWLEVGTVLDSTTVTNSFGCDATYNAHKSIDGTTSKFTCNKMPASLPGIEFSGAQDPSIVEGIRVYCK